MWQCPLCQSPLVCGDTWRCNNNHSFDVSRRGYVNLLPVHKKSTKDPGDNKAMLDARQTFHQYRVYQPLMDKMADVITKSDVMSASGAVVVYDAGCGEGTYLHVIRSALEAAGKSVVASGSDISKSAVDLAARQHRDAQFVVASSFDLPVQDSQIDLMLQVFAPGSDDEFARVLKPQGLLLHVTPGPAHLMALKKAAYKTPREHELPADERPGFTLLSRQRIHWQATLENDSQRKALLQMTPFAWRLDESTQASLCRSLTEVEADFYVSLWQAKQK